jgi:UDPglucose 6-dehydrogenase
MPDDTDAVFITVGTPDGSPDQVLAVAEWLAPSLRGCTVVVVKSTVPPGTCHQVSEIIRAGAPVGASFDVVSNPEFLREGTAVRDFEHERLVIGYENRRARDTMWGLYHRPAIEMGLKEAEMVKLVANAFLHVKTSFVNEIADLCFALGVNTQEVLSAVAADDRIGPGAFAPGPGIGGSCLPKDARALAETAREAGSTMRIVDAAVKSERGHRRRMIDKIMAAGPSVVAVLGLAFKAGTDDTRESPAISIIEGLLERGVSVKVHDPRVTSTGVRFTKWGVMRSLTVEEACADADTVVIMTDEPEYQDLQGDNIMRLT